MSINTTGLHAKGRNGFRYLCCPWRHELGKVAKFPRDQTPRPPIHRDSMIIGVSGASDPTNSTTVGCGVYFGNGSYA